MTGPATTMEHRPVPRLGRDLSVVGLGCWQLGADWGDVPEERAVQVLEAAADAGVNSAAAGLPPTSDTAARAYADLYDRRIREHVHGRW